MLDVVQRLLRVESDVVATVTMPLDRDHSNAEEARIRLGNLLRDAADQVRAIADGARAGRLVARMEAAAEGLDLAGGAHGIVVVATADEAEAHELPFPVRESVVVAPTPATRTLVQGLRRSPRYRILVVSERSARLLQAVRDQVREVTDHGFPMEADTTPRDRRAVAGPFALSPAGDDREQVRRFLRDVDAALAEVARHDPLPLVLAGVRRSTALFEEVGREAKHVLGRLDGNHDRTGPAELGAAAWQIVRETLKARRREVIEQLGNAAATGGAVTGLDESWQLANEGRGRLLVVEEDYRGEPSRAVDGRLVPAGEGERGPDVLVDPVDELVEQVLRTGGSVEFVGSGALAELGHVGLLLR